MTRIAQLGGDFMDRSSEGNLVTRSGGWLCAAALVLMLFNPASASETRIAALALADIPDAATIQIRLPVEEGSDDFELSVVLGAAFESLLAELGYTTVEGDAELIFRFAADEPAFAQAGDLWHRAAFTGGVGGVPRERVSIPIGKTIITRDDTETFRLRVSIARASRPPLWTGLIERPAGGGERRTVFLEMANEIMKFWGMNHP